MALHDDIQESTTSTGTGNLTLGGASESGRTFASEYADGVQFPYKVTDKAGEWETGIGHITSGALVRDTPMYGSAAVPVSFSAGTKQIFVCMQAMSTYEVGTEVFAGNTHKTVFGSNFVRQTGSTIGLLVDRYILIAYMMDRRAGEYDAFQVDITAASTGGDIMFGLYERGTDGRADTRIAYSAWTASTATGVTTATFVGGAVMLSASSKYFIAVIARTSACTVEAGNGTYTSDNLLGVNSSFSRGAYIYHGTITSPTVPANPFGTVTGETVSTADPPYIGLRST